MGSPHICPSASGYWPINTSNEIPTKKKHLEDNWEVHDFYKLAENQGKPNHKPSLIGV